MPPGDAGWGGMHTHHADVDTGVQRTSRPIGSTRTHKHKIVHQGLTDAHQHTLSSYGLAVYDRQILNHAWASHLKQGPPTHLHQIVTVVPVAQLPLQDVE